jgi:hypothetical protein
MEKQKSGISIHYIVKTAYVIISREDGINSKCVISFT